MATSAQEAEQVTATRLSRRSLPGVRIQAFLRLAWRSLLVCLSMLVTQSCIVADPPEYREPVQTRPLLEVYKASPTTTDIVVWATGSLPVTFTVPVRSEDAGNPLSAYTFIDYGTSQERFYSGQTVAASTYDQSRDIPFVWRPVVAPGCHTFTIIVGLAISFLPSDATHLNPATAGDDAAIISWWINVVNPGDTAVNTLTNCPRASLPTSGLPT